MEWPHRVKIAAYSPSVMLHTMKWSGVLVLHLCSLFFIFVCK